MIPRFAGVRSSQFFSLPILTPFPSKVISDPPKSNKLSNDFLFCSVVTPLLSSVVFLKIRDSLLQNGRYSYFFLSPPNILFILFKPDQRGRNFGLFLISSTFLDLCEAAWVGLSPIFNGCLPPSQKGKIYLSSISRFWPVSHRDHPPSSTHKLYMLNPSP